MVHVHKIHYFLVHVHIHTQFPNSTEALLIVTLPLFPPTYLCICRWLKQPGVSAGGSNSPVYLQVAQTAVLKTLIPESL